MERIKLPTIHHYEGSSEGDTNSCAVLVCRRPYRVVWIYKSLLEEQREDGVRTVGRLIESTGFLETAARQQCVGQDNYESFKLVRREKGSETLSRVPLDVCCKCR